MEQSSSFQQEISCFTLSSNNTTETITCSICQAAYAPARSHEHLLQTPPPIALESTFVSMCHFCFRCRRPSCPNCWDDVHGLCRQCTEDTRLSFRYDATPVNGALLPPTRHTWERRAHTARATQSSLTNVHLGRFQMSPLLPIDRVTTRPDRSPITTSSPTAARSDKTFAISEVKTRPPVSPARSLIPPSSLDIDTVKTRPERNELHRVRLVERVLTVIVFTLLSMMLILIIAASFSSAANALIYTNLHVDIRAEITYLWHLLQRLF